MHTSVWRQVNDTLAYASGQTLHSVCIGRRVARHIATGGGGVCVCVCANNEDDNSADNSAVLCSCTSVAFVMLIATASRASDASPVAAAASHD